MKFKAQRIVKETKGRRAGKVLSYEYDAKRCGDYVLDSFGFSPDGCRRDIRNIHKVVTDLGYAFCRPCLVAVVNRSYTERTRSRSPKRRRRIKDGSNLHTGHPLKVALGTKEGV